MVTKERNGSGIHRVARMVNPNLEPLFPGGEITTFQGRTKSYLIETYRSGSDYGFVRSVEGGYSLMNPEYQGLVELARNLYGAVYPERARRNPELTTERILKGLSYPRTILMFALHEGIPVGHGIFPKLDIQGEPVLYSSRAFLAEHEREGLGTHVLERAIDLHRRESARAHRQLYNGMLMTQNWFSIRSLENLKESGTIETIQPIDGPYDAWGRHLLYGVHARVFVSSTAIEDSGLSRGELREVGINEAATRPEEGTRAWEIYQTMVLRPPDGAGLNIYNGDVLYVRFTFPRPVLIATA